LNGWKIPFVNNVKYLGVIFDKEIKWRLYIESFKAKASQTFIRLYPLFKTEPLTANIKLTILRVLIRSVMTYACPAWEFAAETQPMKLQRLQNWVLPTIGNFPRRMSVHGLDVAFQVPYVYDYITKLCRQQTGAIQSNDNKKVHKIGKGEARHRKYRKLKLVGCHVYDRSSVLIAEVALATVIMA
jgi:hypothetical protein